MSGTACERPAVGMAVGGIICMGKRDGMEIESLVSFGYLTCMCARVCHGVSLQLSLVALVSGAGACTSMFRVACGAACLEMAPVSLVDRPVEFAPNLTPYLKSYVPLLLAASTSFLLPLLAGASLKESKDALALRWPHLTMAADVASMWLRRT